MSASESIFKKVEFSEAFITQPDMFEELKTKNYDDFLMEQRIDDSVRRTIDNYIYRQKSSRMDIEQALHTYLNFAREKNIPRGIIDLRAKTYTLEARAYMHKLWVSKTSGEPLKPQDLESLSKQFNLAANVWQFVYGEPIWEYYKDHLTFEDVRELLPGVYTSTQMPAKEMRLSLRLR